MHYYPHHIGDFIRDTARLTDAQCMAYLRLIWMYYDQEGPISDDHASLAFQIGSDQESVRLILDHFFSLDANAMRTHKRCDQVIAEYRAKSEKAAKSASARWNNANAMRTHTERNANAPKNDANQEPITNNQEKTISPDGDRQPSADGESLLGGTTTKSMTVKQLVSLGVREQVAREFIALRNRKKAPLSPLALDGIRREVAIAGVTLEAAMLMCVERGWQSFKAEWLKGQTAETKVEQAPAGWNKPFPRSAK